MVLLLRYLRHQWRAVSAALAFAVVNQVFLMADPLIFRRIIDDYVVQSQRRTRADFFLGAGLWLAAMIAAVFVAWVAKNLQSDQVSRVSHRVSAAMFADGIRHSLELPFAEFEQRRSGETLDRLQKLRGSVERFLVIAANNLFTTLVGVVFVIVYGATIHWAIAP